MVQYLRLFLLKKTVHMTIKSMVHKCVKFWILFLSDIRVIVCFSTAMNVNFCVGGFQWCCRLFHDSL